MGRIPALLVNLHCDCGTLRWFDDFFLDERFFFLNGFVALSDETFTVHSRRSWVGMHRRNARQVIVNVGMPFPLSRNHKCVHEGTDVREVLAP